MGDTPNPAPWCSRCGKALSPDASEGLCAACLLMAGADTLSQSMAAAPTEWGEDAPAAGDPLRLIAGQTWGPYRIVRLLGRGGMGEVYEAEHLKTGRRLALKVLRSRLQNAEERARFIREGQLAASISHPHTVYIFGSEEISGTPVISMELTPGGTLKDRVASHGPLTPTEAVAAVLDIIGGLGAAQSAGILHRDIKPSNCFLDSQGGVKVGDFGLSISTLARDVQDDVSGRGFQGTPQFAAPEQLRGEPLDVRADIYAVGATLFYLLTGRPPFEASNLHELVDKVTAAQPRSPRLLRSGIPAGLAAAVLKCLARAPSQRPPSYAALSDALRPFSAAGTTPASLGVRAVANLIDTVILSLVTFLIVWVLGHSPVQEQYAEGTLQAGWVLLAYCLMEGFWGATPGKRLFGLRVTSVDGGVASWKGIVRRHVLFNLPIFLAWVPVILIVGPERFDAAFKANPSWLSISSVAVALVSYSYFLTARRRNGWAGLHDWASGTRVIAVRRQAERPAHGEIATSPLTEERPLTGLEYGPFTVVADAGAAPSGTAHAGAADEGRLLVAFDRALRRRVWIRTVSAGTPAISASRRDALRAGRLRWLTGRRSEEENWDAFEAPSGEPFLTQRLPIPWSTMKTWLLDLANELHLAVQEQSLPRLALDRIWIRQDGRLVLLDFPVGAPEARMTQDLSPTGLLSAIATHGLSQNGKDPAALPLSVRTLIDRWAQPSAPDLTETRMALMGLSSLTRVSTWRRAVPIVVVLTPFLLTILAAGLMEPSILRHVSQERVEIIGLLNVFRFPEVRARDKRLTDPAFQDVIERYVAGRFGATIRDEAFWGEPPISSNTSQELRELAQGILTRHPSVSAEETAQAGAILAAHFAKHRGSSPEVIGPPTPIRLVGAEIIYTAWLVIPLSLLSAAVIPGGVIVRAMGLAVVTRNGRQIRRWRSVVRVLVAWSPLIAWYASAFYFTYGAFPLLSFTLKLFPISIGAVWAIAHPARGVHDYVMGTWVVPR